MVHRKKSTNLGTFFLPNRCTLILYMTCQPLFFGLWFGGLAFVTASGKHKQNMGYRKLRLVNSLENSKIVQLKNNVVIIL